MKYFSYLVALILISASVLFIVGCRLTEPEEVYPLTTPQIVFCKYTNAEISFDIDETTGDTIVSSNVLEENTVPRVFLVWTGQPRALGYKIYRGPTRESIDYSNAFMIVRGRESTNFRDIYLTPGYTYYYTITAFRTLSDESGYSAILSEKVPGGTNLPAPGFVTASGGGNNDYVLVSWTNVTNAALYTVTYNEYFGSYPIDIASIYARSNITLYSGISLAHTNYILALSNKPALYVYQYSNYYNSNATKGDGIYTIKCEFVDGEKRIVNKQTRGTYHINLAWEEVYGADGYIVYHSDTESGEFERIASVYTTNYSDYGRPPQSVHYYRVSAFDEDGEGSKQQGAWANTLNVKYLTAPSNFTATSLGASSISLSWSNLSGYEKYVIFRAPDIAGPYTHLVTTNTNYYLDSSLSYRTKYYYRVGESNKEYGLSINFAYANATTTGYLSAPTNVSVSASGTNIINMAWFPIVNSTPVSYRIDSSTDNSNFTPAGTTEATNFAVTNLTESTTYYLRLYAIDYVGVSTNYVSSSATTLADTNAPLFITNFPSATNITGKGFVLHIQINEPGTVYYKVLTNNATAPTPSSLFASSDGTITVSEGYTTVASSVSGKSELTSYDVYFVASDSKSTTNKQTSVTMIDITTPSLVRDVYVSGGYYGSGAFRPAYWKNGVKTDLDATPDIEPPSGLDIFVRNSDIYVAGSIYQNSVENAVYWKNNARLAYSSGDYTHALYVTTNDIVYGGGYDYNNSVYYPGFWISGSFVILSTNINPAKVLDITVSGTTAYLSGYSTDSSGNHYATYWKVTNVDSSNVASNASSTIMAVAEGAKGYAIGVVGSDIYVAGNKTTNTAALWKNGAEVTTFNNAIAARGLAVSGTNLYVCGWSNYGGTNYAVYWIYNTSAASYVQSNLPGTNAEAHGIAVSQTGSHVYVAGRYDIMTNTPYYGTACYWVDGAHKKFSFASDVSNSEALSIFCNEE